MQKMQNVKFSKMQQKYKCTHQRVSSYRSDQNKVPLGSCWLSACRSPPLPQFQCWLNVHNRSCKFELRFFCFHFATSEIHTQKSNKKYLFTQVSEKSSQVNMEIVTSDLAQQLQDNKSLSHPRTPIFQC